MIRWSKSFSISGSTLYSAAQVAAMQAAFHFLLLAFSFLTLSLSSRLSSVVRALMGRAVPYGIGEDSITRFAARVISIA